MLGVVTDSGCGITEKFVEKMGDSFIMVGMKIVMDKTYVDGKFDKEKFYNWVLSANKIARTSQPSPLDFESAYRELFKRGCDEILSLHISSRVSGAFNSARIAAKNVDANRIHVVDSFHISAGAYFMLRRILDYVEEGVSLDKALKRLNFIRKNSTVFFTVSTLDYLIKNGRIGKATGLVGSVLKLSPIFTVKEGENALASIARGKKRLFSKMADMCRSFIEGKSHVRMLFSYSASQSLNVMEELKSVVGSRVDLSEFEIETLKMWPTITAHTGPTTVGVGCYAE